MEGSRVNNRNDVPGKAPNQKPAERTERSKFKKKVEVKVPFVSFSSREFHEEFYRDFLKGAWNNDHRFLFLIP